MVNGPNEPDDEFREVPPRHTRISGLWTAVAVLTVLGICLVVFVVQNTRTTRIDFFTASGHLPVAVVALGSAVAGALVVLIVGVSRTSQIRLSARRRWKAKTAASEHEAD
jgi:uncharacterized integral membrane protein